jgi:nucleoside-diphosphate-sugar epimerase
LFDELKRILITGANGFVGSYLSRFLQKAGYEVTALVCPTADCALLHPETKSLKCDFEHSQLQEILASQDVIIHCAALVRALCWDDYYQANVALTAQLLALYNQLAKPAHFIYLSSQAAAGMAAPGQLKTETDACLPITDYGRSKRLAEHHIMQHSKKPWSIIRPTSVYGPGDKDFLLYFKLVNRHLALTVGPDKKQLSFIYVEELANLIQRVIETPQAQNEIFFAADGKTYRHADLVHALQQAIPNWSISFRIPDTCMKPVALVAEINGRIRKKPPVLSLQKSREIAGENWTVSIAKATRILGFKPQPDLERHICETLHWYRAKGLL